MKKAFIPLALATALFTTGCKDSENIIDTPSTPDLSDHEAISFSMSDAQGATTRAGFTGSDTRIIARIQSEENGGTGVRYTKTVLKATKDAAGGGTDYSAVDYFTTDNTRYWDDAFGRKGQLSVYAVAIPNTTSDTYLAEGKLSGGTWATESTPDNTIDWIVTYTTTQTTNTTTFGTLEKEDLVYSNNIQENGSNGCYKWDYSAGKYPDLNGGTSHSSGRMVFTLKDGAQPSDAGHFDKGHLVFNHALTRLTIELEEGTGFNNSSSADFKFNKITGEIKSGNIMLLGFPVHGKLDVKNGSWEIDASDGTQNILQMIGAAATTETTAPAASSGSNKYSAQMLPGKKFYEDADGTATGDNVMQFCIDDNTYYITQKMMYEALATSENTTAGKVTIKTESSKNYIEMEQGKNYTIKLKVNKTKIESVSATLEPWVNVAGEYEVNNAHITLSLNTTGNACNKDIDLYRLEDDNDNYDRDQYVFNYAGKRWFGNYQTDAEHKTTLLQSAISTSKTWSTPWYYDSNKTYYHFRTVNSGTQIKGNTDSGNDTDFGGTTVATGKTADYFEISAGATEDPHWGAPMKTNSSVTWLKYDTNKGYEDFVSPAIGATKDEIKIQELHMMSNIKVVLTTPNNGGKVELSKTEGGTTTNTIVKITRMYKTGTVEMGRGVVNPTKTAATGEEPMTTPSDFWKVSNPATNEKYITNEYTFAVVPQELYRGTNDTEKENDDFYVGIFIQTPDNNQYYVVKKLSDIVATTVSDQRNQTQNSKIVRWYPGHTYTYTFNITKTKIDVVSCTVADWVDITAADTPIDLES